MTARTTTGAALATSPSLPPGFRAPSVLQTWRYVNTPRRFADDGYRRFGEAFTTNILGMGRVVVLSNLEAIRELFSGPQDVFITGQANARMFESFLGKHSLLNIDGDHHRRKRAIIMPPFHGRRVRAFGETMARITRETMARWPVDQAFPIQAQTQAITMDIILRLVFGVDDDALCERMRKAIATFIEGSHRPSAVVMGIRAAQIDLGPWSPWGRILRQRNAVYDCILAAIAERRAAGYEGRNDILSQLLAARDEDDNPLPDDELRDDLFTLMLAGHETTAASLAWAFWAILSRPEVVAKLRAEIGGSFDPERIDQLPYLDAVIKEVLRLHPVTDGVARVLAAPAHLGRWFLPGGIIVAASTWLTHRHPELWDEPERFMPERFMSGRFNPHALLHFGGGPRRCVGAAFATYEMKAVLGTVFASARLELEPGYRAEILRRVFTLSPRAGVPVILRGS